MRREKREERRVVVSDWAPQEGSTLKSRKN